MYVSFVTQVFSGGFVRHNESQTITNKGSAQSKYRQWHLSLLINTWTYILQNSSLLQHQYRQWAEICYQTARIKREISRTLFTGTQQAKWILIRMIWCPYAQVLANLAIAISTDELKFLFQHIYDQLSPSFDSFAICELTRIDIGQIAQKLLGIW